MKGLSVAQKNCGGNSEGADEPIIRSFGAAPDGFGYEYEDVVIDEDHGVARKWNGQPVAI